MEESVSEFLKSVDPGLVAYKEEFIKHSVTSDMTLKFFRPREVREMNIPTVYKRMVIAKILALQSSPSSRQKLLPEAESPELERIKDYNIVTAHTKAKQTLFGDRDPPGLGVSPFSSVEKQSATETEKDDPKVSFTQREKEKLTDEITNIKILLDHRKDELQNLKITPQKQPVIGLGGHTLMRVVCDRCHHQGHRQSGNRGGAFCTLERCEGYHYCGLMNKHPEHKQHISEVSKDILQLEKRIKSLESERENLIKFESHNKASFVLQVRPILQKSNSERYNSSKKGKQNLIRDIRYVQIACKNTVPPNLDVIDWKNIISKGKSMVKSNYTDLSDLSESEEEVNKKKKLDNDNHSQCHVDHREDPSAKQTQASDPFWQMYNPQNWGSYANYIPPVFQQSPANVVYPWYQQYVPTQHHMLQSPVTYGQGSYQSFLQNPPTPSTPYQPPPPPPSPPKDAKN